MFEIYKFMKDLLGPLMLLFDCAFGAKYNLGLFLCVISVLNFL